MDYKSRREIHEPAQVVYRAVVIASLVSGSLRANAAELPFDNSDFEKGTLVNWTAAGDDHKVQPIKDGNPTARAGAGVAEFKAN